MISARSVAHIFFTGVPLVHGLALEHVQGSCRASHPVKPLRASGDPRPRRYRPFSCHLVGGPSPPVCVAVADIRGIFEGRTGFLWHYFGRLAGLERAPSALERRRFRSITGGGGGGRGLLIVVVVGGGGGRGGGLGGVPRPLATASCGNQILRRMLVLNRHASTSTPSTRHPLDGVAASVPHWLDGTSVSAPDTLVDFHTGKRFSSRAFLRSILALKIPAAAPSDSSLDLSSSMISGR